MRRIMVFAVALLSLTLVLAARPAPSAQADADFMMLIGCEFIAAGIDGDVSDSTVAGDYALCTTPLSTIEISYLDEAYGDGDNILEPSDLAAPAGLDDDQLRSTCTAAAPQCTLLVFTFVDDEATVTLDLPAGLQSVQSGNLDYVCDTEAEDADCSDVNPIDGDGVVVFHIFNESAVPGGQPVVRVSQEGVEQAATVKIVGAPASVDLVLSEQRIQVSPGFRANECDENFDVHHPATLAAPNATIVHVAVRDAGARALTRVSAQIRTSNSDRAFRADGDVSNGVVANTGVSVVGPQGIAQYAVICGHEERGTVDVIAEVGAGPVLTDSASLTIVGEAVSMTLTAAPPSILCDGAETSTVTATVRDIDGALVADGVRVHFGVYVIGVANPIDTTTVNGLAASVARGLSAFTQGLPVIVSADGASLPDVQRSILITCTGFDTDGDGMPNTFEAGKACLNSIVSDSHIDQDDDGLASLLEYQLSTNPCVVDTDTDGCGDGAERGGDRFFGGERDPLDLWDFYDVTADKLIDLSDTLAILGKFGVGVNDVGYIPALDRYAPNPSQPWRTAQSIDGAGIDLTDALVNLDSFGDDCNAA